MTATRRTIFAALVACAVGITGCSGPSTTPDAEQLNEPATELTAPASSSASAGVGSDANEPAAPPAPRNGRSSAAVRSVADYFAVRFSQFSPFVFDPAGEWFDSWQALATPPLVGQMQVGLIDVWGWTWQQQVKAYDSRVVGTSSVTVNDAADTATATVLIDRLVLGINDTADKARQQNRRYRLQLTLRGTSEMALVSAVDESVLGQ